MRTTTFLILNLFCFNFAYAADVTLKAVTHANKTAYTLEAGAFPHENNALQLKFKLSSQFRQPVNIEYINDRKLYLVQIGPINDLKKAQEIQHKLSENQTLAKISERAVPKEAPVMQDRTELQAEQVDTQEEQAEMPNQQTQAEDEQTQAPEIQTRVPETRAPSNNGKTQANAKPGNKLWNLRNADIRAVIAEVSRITGINFVIDPRVQGKISIVSNTPMSDKELYQVFLSVLQVSGYSAIPSGEITKIVPNIDAKTITADMLSGMRNPPRGDDMLVQVIPVQYVPAEQLVPVLRPLMPQWSSIAAYGPSNMLILSGRANNIRQLATIIRQVDSSNASGIDVVHLRHALAMDIAATLKDIVKSSPNAGSTRSQLMIAADDRSNAILISGSRTDRIRLRMLIAKLDKGGGGSNGANSNTQVVYLNYLRAEDLVPILAGIAQANFSGNVGTTIGTITQPALDSTNPSSSLANTSSSGSSSLQNSGSGGSVAAMSPQNTGNPAATPNTTGATTQNEGSTKPTAQIIAEPNTNSIIINAPANLIRILKNVIRQLDIRPAQLLIEALVAEVNEQEIKSLGIEWGSTQQTADGTNTRGFSNGFAIINTKTTIADFQAQIYALARQNRANILSTPSVVVLDNRQAKILVGSQVSVQQSTQQNTVVGGAPFTTFQRMNVALHLYVRPQITEGNGIQMQIDEGNDTLDPASTDSTNPTFRVSAIVTSVHVESGDIVVLGGLTQDRIDNAGNRIPILGDIPGLGKLFQRNIDTREKRVLMVFIKPIILKNEKDAIRVSGEKYNNVRQYQLDWLQSQEFSETNNEMLLPALDLANLPEPFERTLPPPAAAFKK